MGETPSGDGAILRQGSRKGHMISFLREIRDRLPPSLEPMAALADSLMKRLNILFGLFHGSAYELKGPEKHGGHDLTAVFMGGSASRAYLSNLLFLGNPAIRALGRFSHRKIVSLLDETRPRADLIFLESPPLLSSLFRKRGCLIMPQWVGTRLEMTGQGESFLKASGSKSLREDLRRIRKQKYRYRVSRNQEDFDFYYHRMHIPYISHRFDDLALLTRYKVMERLWKKGFLVLVSEEGREKEVSGGLCFIRDDTFYLRTIGVLDGREEFVSQMALAAVEYFALRMAVEAGCLFFDFGLSRPFLRDGVLVYKKKWGGRLIPSPRNPGMWAFKVLRFHGGTLSFLENNPLVFDALGEPAGLVFHGGGPLSPTDISMMTKTFFHRGMKALWILSPSGFDRSAAEGQTGGAAGRIHVIAEDPSRLFQKSFCASTVSVGPGR